MTRTDGRLPACRRRAVTSVDVTIYLYKDGQSWGGRIIGDAQALWSMFIDGSVKLRTPEGSEAAIVITSVGRDCADFVGSGPPPGMSP